MGFKEDLKKPFNLVTFILAIVGLILTIFFYYKSEKEKSISYNINERTSLIYDSKNSASAINIYDKDSLPIKENVYLINGMVWNSGDYSILKNDIRIPLSISLNNSCRLLDYKITSQKDKSIAKFKLASTNKNTLNVDWKYFDPKYGFRFQLIYVSKDTSLVKLNGKILDINQFNNVKKPNTDFYSLIFLGLCILIGYLTSALVKLFCKKILKMKDEAKYMSLIKFAVFISVYALIFTIFLPVFKAMTNSIPLI